MSCFQGEDGEKRDEDATPAPAGGGGEAKLTNQFNFSERASQTYNNPYRVSGIYNGNSFIPCLLFLEVQSNIALHSMFECMCESDYALSVQTRFGISVRRHAVSLFCTLK